MKISLKEVTIKELFNGVSARGKIKQNNCEINIYT